MPAKQLKETTMDQNNRILIRVNLPRDIIPQTSIFVDDVMGKNPEKRLKFIKDKVKANDINFVDWFIILNSFYKSFKRIKYK